MKTPSEASAKQPVAAPGFRLWLITVAGLTAMFGPVLNSEDWASWDEARRTLKVINWAIGALLAMSLFWFVPHRMGWISMLRGVPWIFVAVFFAAFVFASSDAIRERSFPEIAELARIVYAGVGAVAWFAFLRRYPFVLRADRYSDTEWRRLVK